VRAGVATAVTESPLEQRRRVRADLRNSLPTSYFTLISLIQGTALGFLGSVVRDGVGAWGAAQWLSALSTFLIVVQVWNEYRMSVSVWAGIPVLQDSIIPFSLGATEFWLIFAIPDPRAWMLALSFVSLGGVVAYFHVQRLRDLPENQEMTVHSPYMRAQLTWSVIYGAIFLALYFLLRTNAIGAAVSSSIALGMVALLLVRSEWHWRRVLRVVESWADESLP